MSTKRELIRLSCNEAYLRYSQIQILQTSEYENWLKDCKSNLTFYEGGNNQWTQEELDALSARGGYTITMDMTRKALSSIVGMLTANKPDLKAIPVGEEDDVKANIRTMMLKQTWKDADGLMKVRDIATNAYKSNIAYALVSPWRNRMTFRMLTYEQVMVDPTSTDPMFRDAEHIWIKKWIPVEKVKAVYGLESINTSYPTDWANNDFAQQALTDKIFDNARRYMQIFEGYRKVPTRLPNGEVKTRIYRETLIGYEYLFRDILPESITEYPIIPLYSSLSNNPLKFSEMHYMKEPQRFINKMYNITIMNAQATGSPKVFVRSTDIPNEDVQAFSDNYAIPGSINELNPGAEIPFVVNAQPLNNAFFTLYQDATQYLFRIYSSMGLDGSAVDSSASGNNVSLYEKREAVMDSLKIISGLYELFLKQLGLCILQGWSAYVSKDEVVKCTEAMNVIAKVEQDMKDGLDVRNPQNLQNWIKTMQQKKVNQVDIENYIFEAEQRSEFIDAIFDTLNNIGDLDYDVMIVQDSYAPSYQAGKYNIALQLAEKGIIDGETLLELSPLDGKEKIMRRLSTVKNQASQIEQMSMQIQELDSELKQRESQIKDMILKGIQTTEQVKFDKLYGDQRAKTYINKQAMGLDRTEKNRQLDYAIKEFMLELKQNKNELRNIEAEDITRAIQI